MTDSYDGNGDYSSYNDDDNDYGKQRKALSGGPGGPHNGDNSNHDHHHHHGVGSAVMGGPVGGPHDGQQMNDKANEYIRECLTEKNRIDKKFPIAEKLLDCEIEKVQTTGRIPSREQKYADIYREKPLRVSQKVLVPIREHPKFNFVGKLLGPKGNSLRRLQEETLCKMTVLGRNSMRDRVKEEELRASKDPKFAHLNSDLHVEISTIAPPAEAYARIAYAMAELRKYLIPDSNDGIRQEQLRELMDNTGITDHDGAKSTFKKMPPHQTQQQNIGGGGIGVSGGGIGLSGGVVTPGSGGAAQIGKNMPPHHGGYRTPSQQPFAKNTIPPKQKVMSILEKARTAMDETYGRGYDEHAAYEQQAYDSYSYGHAPTHAAPPHGPQNSSVGVSGIGGARGPYDTPEYEPEYNRRDYYQHSPNYGATGGTGQQQPQQQQPSQPTHQQQQLSVGCGSIGTAGMNPTTITSTNGTPVATTTTQQQQHQYNNSFNHHGLPATHHQQPQQQQMSTTLQQQQTHQQQQLPPPPNNMNATSLTNNIQNDSNNIPSLSHHLTSMNSQKTQQQQQSNVVASNRIQGPAAATAAAANLLFVRPANPSLHVGKLPFLPVQFL